MDIGIVLIMKRIHKYGTFETTQLQQAQNDLRKSIFFLLLIADPKNANLAEYKDVDVEEAFNSLMYRIDGLNELLGYPSQIVLVLSMLEEAKKVYNRKPFNFKIYRKLVLDAGNEVLKIEEVDGNA